MIDPAGRILTTSASLGKSPLVEFVTFGGSSGLAWADGRDDNFDLALLRVLDPPQSYDFIELSSTGPPAIGEELLLMQYISGGRLFDKRAAFIVGARPDLNSGILYQQIFVPAVEGAQGGALVDTQAQLRGVRMSTSHLVLLGVALLETETYLITADALRNLVLPRLEAGTIVINPAPVGGPSVPPPLPAIFKGNMTVNGEPGPGVGRIYGRASRAGQADVWFTQELTKAGRYNLPADVPAGYSNAAIDFWFDGKQAGVTRIYSPGNTYDVDLDFS